MFYAEPWYLSSGTRWYFITAHTKSPNQTQNQSRNVWSEQETLFVYFSHCCDLTPVQTLRVKQHLRCSEWLMRLFAAKIQILNCSSVTETHDRDTWQRPVCLFSPSPAPTAQIRANSSTVKWRDTTDTHFTPTLTPSGWFKRLHQLRLWWTSLTPGH